MKTLTLSLLFTLSALFALASTDYTSSTYTIFGQTNTFTNKVDLGKHSLVYDCYTENGKKLATVVSYNYPDPSNLHESDLRHVSCYVPTEVTYNGQNYTVTKVADKAFSNFASTTVCFLNNISLPKSVEDIGDNAFQDMILLLNLNMGNGVRKIGKNAFKDCHSLSAISVSDKLVSIGDNAFYGCVGLQTFSLPSTIVSLGNGAFANCDGMKYLEWDLDPERWNIFSFSSASIRLPGTVLVHTKTREQAAVARIFVNKVVCDEDEAYIKDLENNTTMLENVASQYTMLQQESQALQVHNNNLNNCDVNQDGLVNGTDVVTIYNRIIQGTETYNGQAYVDLELPSGTLWATCNVGAPSPECVGDYFAWGENGFYSYRYGLAFGKYSFTKDTYIPAPGVKDIKDGEWPQEYSPLKVIYIAQWDGWKIPSEAQAEELFNNCTIGAVTINGQMCTELTSKNNHRKIYFPANGIIDGTSAKRPEYKYYWTSTCRDYYPIIMPFSGYTDTSPRYYGMGIRPVIMKEDLEK